MSAGWVAGSVRARALARRRLGPVAARQIAASGSLEVALTALSGTAYGRNARPDSDIAAAQHGIASGLLWDLRVLAGWLPRDGVRMLRVLAGWFELANIEETLAAHPGPSFDLGALATAWPRLRGISPAGLRAALAASAWRDPGGTGARAIAFGMRARWAARVAELGEPATSWAAGAAALLIAAERLGSGRDLDREALGNAARLTGTAVIGATTLPDLQAALPPRARWVLAGIDSPGDLWRGEVTWRARVDEDALRLLRTSSLDSGVVLGAVAVMACDALRVRAALEAAARGSDPGALEAYDALA
jgi:hypothetical protein